MTYFYMVLGLVVLWSLIQSWRHQARTETVQPWKSFSHLLAWYLPFIFFPLWAWVAYWAVFGELSLWFAIPIIVLLSVCIYARFIEPKMLRVQYHQRAHFLVHQSNEAPRVKIALIADLHIGLFSGHCTQLEKIIKKINEINPDMVLVAGDWTYEPFNTLQDDLQIFKQLNMPVYSVLGNHDEEHPGPPIKAILQQGLEQANIIDIEGCIIEHDGFYLVGVGDLWAGNVDMQLLPKCPTDKPYVIMAHNPDTIDLVPNIDSQVLMMSGHTHGGQVSIPLFTNYYLRRTSILGHRAGWYQHGTHQLFVTVGTGMVGVPFRFLTPPTIDVIELS